MGGYMKYLQAPFPYFGGKMAVADVVWQHLGDVKHYIEPFFGSGAVLLARPNYDYSRHIETVCDADGHIANVWRAIKHAPDEVAEWCDYPVNHIDLYARRQVLINNTESLTDKLLNDETYYDAKLAGYWIWATSQWIGTGMLERGKYPKKVGEQLPHITRNGMGIHRLGMRSRDVSVGILPKNEKIYNYMRQLADRLRHVRVVTGDWTRVCGGNWQDRVGTVGIFFDPPYSDLAGRDSNIYRTDSLNVAHTVREWCLKRGDKNTYRIVLAGYYDEHEELLNHGWKMYRWKTSGGYGNRKKTGENKNRYKETLFISPHCVYEKKLLF